MPSSVMASLKSYLVFNEQKSKSTESSANRRHHKVRCTKGAHIMQRGRSIKSYKKKCVSDADGLLKGFLFSKGLCCLTSRRVYNLILASHDVEIKEERPEELKYCMK